MSRDGESQLVALERAIMARAEDLAQEFHDKAKRQKDTILRDAAERLHMAEEREVLVAKAEAERHFRRVTQASELKLQARLDQLRWEMVQTVQTRLTERMQKLCADHTVYRAWLVEMIRQAAALLPAGDLTAEVNADDLSWLSTQWQALATEAAPERTIHLAEKATWGSGGVKLRTADNRAQVDNRFEGRISRLEAAIQRSILQQLFPADINASARIGGPQ
ncbi:MAG: ATPase [Gammaproteobacteria bacterium]|nr:ATPase [Gammaproteobacteria bacterium]MCP5316587.1 ATPase [Chromatiaceae bacterium]MCW5585745.1 ATPase [Chromatiales bacterium]MCP5429695.1 ATPase [Chromatiaceae bacterium]MCP5434106.1 ATPase [Chromatiaceae bacterium]